MHALIAFIDKYWLVFGAITFLGIFFCMGVSFGGAREMTKREQEIDEQ